MNTIANSPRCKSKVWARTISATRTLALSLVVSLGFSHSQAQITSFSHVILVVQENRTPDNLFQGLCGPQRSLCPTPYDLQNWGLNYGQKVLLQETPLGSRGDPLHDHLDFLELCDLDPNTHQCKMDGAEQIHCIVGIKRGPNCSFECVQSADVQPYLTMAQQYGWANYMFSTSQGGSLPGHQFLFSGTSAPSADDDATGVYGDRNVPTNAASGCVAQETTYVTLITPDGDKKAYPCFEHEALPDVLPEGVSWRYYTSNTMAGYWTAPNAIKHICQPSKPYGGKCLGPEFVENVDLRAKDVLTDIATCKLRSISWVIPNGLNSDHPGSPYHKDGPSWVASIVNAVGNSTKCDNNTGYWKDTAIVVVWDDFGGFYDHEPPPLLDPPEGDFQLGARVPLLFISAYTPASYVDNNQQDFGSILRFLEYNFGIEEGILNFADARAKNDLTTFYDLKKVPRIFLRISAPLDANFFLNDRRPPTPPDND